MPHQGEKLAAVALSPAQRQAILAEAVAAGTRECCGLLVGRRDGDLARVIAVVPARNVAREPERFFEIDPRLLIATHRAAREAGETILGWYHSHPRGDVLPSECDAAHAVEAGKVWLVVAGGAIGAYVAEERGVVAGRFRPLPLQVISPPETEESGNGNR
ncbi:M67 family metallopeptidase [Pedomonas mirosovicensis]|uniref:M67 family metallopeptidase n=1 Tax=Pedomonas mirosovicensis TaxID=2908641 RepID=UPI00216A7EBF|nr:M67 family metallopeptidase [Pedomonas mirosovicensis]MCH8685591.1 M67 family metallopeptidase [Pedomonas mirosovicensis]